MTTLPSPQPTTDELLRRLMLAQRETWLNIARQAMKQVRQIEREYGLVPEKK
jgi:hypothetical protein